MQGLGGLRAVTLEGLGFRVWVGLGRSPESGEFLLLVYTILTLFLLFCILLSCLLSPWAC